jgi:hypothetical protein
MNNAVRMSFATGARVAVFVSCFALSVGANAIPIEIPGPGQDIPKNGTGIAGGNANDDANNFFRLQTVVNAYNLANPGNPLITPQFSGVVDLTSPVVGPGGLVGFDYAVVHYGAGDGGTQGSGGGVEIFFLNGATSFSFPDFGSGPNGYGGFSSLTLYDAPPSVPDSGTTLWLLGAVLSGLGLIRRKLS